MPKELFNQSQVDTLADSDRLAAGVPGQTGAKNILYSKFVEQIQSQVTGVTPEQAASILSSQTRLDTLTIKARQLTGFENPIDTLVAYEATTRTVILTGDVSAYWQGNPMTSIDPTFVSGWESAPHDVPVGIQTFFLYFNGTDFVWSNTPWTFDLLQIALIFRDGVNFGIRECHGLLDQYTHDIIHKVIGTRMTSGGDLTGFTLNSTTAANRRPLIASALVEDEDLPTVLDALATPSYSWFSLSSADTIAITQAQTEIISITGNQPNYNQFTGGNWVQTPFPVNAYAKIFVFAIPVSDSVGCQPNRFIFVQPQTVNTSLETIQNLTTGSVNLAGLAPAINEFVYFAEVIIRFTSGNWQLISVAKITGSQIGQAVLSGNFLSSVTTDATLTGGGTALNPLGVSVAISSHIDTFDNLKHESFQIINEEGLPNLEVLNDAKVSDILGNVNARLFEQIGFNVVGQEVDAIVGKTAALTSIPYAFKAYELGIDYEVVPTGSSAIITFYKNGVSIGTVTVLSGQDSGLTALGSVVSFAKGDTLRATVTQEGLTIKGQSVNAYIQGIKYQ